MTSAAGQFPAGSAFVPSPAQPAIPHQYVPTPGEQALPSVAPPELFSFTADDGTRFTSRRPLSSNIVTPGLVRTSRQDEMGFVWTVIEHLFEDQPDARAAVDSSWACLRRVVEAMPPFIERAVRLGMGE